MYKPQKAEVKEKPELLSEQGSEEEESSSFKIADSEMKKVKFLCDVSQFVGPNLEIYGPFKSEETAVLPQTVCNVLLNKNKAEFSENSS